MGVTAGHVIDGYQKTTATMKGPLTLTSNGNAIHLDIESRMTDSHPGIDIATFTVTEDEVRRLGHLVLTGGQKT
jgi:hypothetical protein